MVNNLKIKIYLSQNEFIRVNPDDIFGIRMNFFGNTDIKIKDGIVYHSIMKYTKFVKIMEEIQKRLAQCTNSNPVAQCSTS